MKKRIALLVVLLIGLASGLGSEEIKKLENFIYSIHAFDGQIYRSTFAREDSKTIFLLADTDSFLSTRKTFIYYFPALEGYRVDTDIVNYPYTGTLEIMGEGIKLSLSPVLYTYTNMPEQKATDQSSQISGGGDEVTSSNQGILRVYKGEAAKNVWVRYQAMLDEYRAAAEKWEAGAREFQEWQKSMVQKIREARAAGKDTSGLVSEVQTQHYPYPPERPNYQVEPLLEAFVVNLHVGNYTMLLRDKDGFIVEGSEKRLVVFREKRNLGICYQYASMDKITMPVLSQESRSVIYIDGKNDLYIQGFYQNEYNEFYHNKLVQNDSMGSVFRTKAATADKVTDSWLELYEGSKVTDILLEELYYIQTDSSKDVGYSIVVWDGRPNQPMQYVNPNFSGFYIPLAKIKGSLDVRLRNIQDNVYEGSEREIRIVRNSPFAGVVYILSLVPIAVMIRILMKRRKLYTKV